MKREEIIERIQDIEPWREEQGPAVDGFYSTSGYSRSGEYLGEYPTSVDTADEDYNKYFASTLKEVDELRNQL